MVRLMMLAAGILVCAPATCPASGYSIAYAVYKEASSDRGTADCAFNAICKKRIKALDLTQWIVRRGRQDSNVYVQLIGGEGSCLFDDANATATVDSRQRSHSLVIFEGKARAGNEFVQNTRVGRLRLEFVDLQQQ